ncbi:MAG TPA: hypothetical protein VGF89_14195 [Steroidobacteraceae bacterium]|jgi:hypothetical protein
MQPIAVAIAALITLAPAAALAVELYQGYAYASGGERLIYRESHWLYSRDGVPQRLVIYRCPDGSAFVRKHVDSAPGETTPDVDLIDGRAGYREGVQSLNGRREVFAQADAQAPLRRSLLPRPPPPNAVIDSGFDAFVREHWDVLSGPGISPVPFLVPSQLRYVDFSARLLRDEHRPDGDLRWFRLALASWYGFALPHIDVAYDRNSHQLRLYSGLSNIRDGDGRNLNVTIRFPATERRDNASPAELEQAEAMPLNGRCTFR